MSDLIEAYDSVIGDTDTENPVESLSRNANIHMGDDDLDIETADEVVDDSEDVDSETDVTDIESDDSAESDDDDATDDLFDFDSIKDKPIQITVSGETFEVPLGELRNGYMRQADYTRKTQAIAQFADQVKWAQQVQQALQDDPKSTLVYLANQLGVNLVDDASDDYDDPTLTPLKQELNETRQQLAELRAAQQQFEQQRVDMSVRSEIDGLKAKYDDFDPMVVLPLAIQEGLSAEKAYKLWKAERLEQETAAQKKAREKAEKAAEARQKAKQASAKVSRGGSAVKAAADDSWKSFDSFEEIFEHEMNRTRS